MPVSRCDGWGPALKLRNESRTNRGRIADSIDFGLRSRDISSASARLPQHHVARKAFATFSRLEALTRGPITLPPGSQGGRHEISEENVQRRAGRGIGVARGRLTGSARRSGALRAKER